MSTFRVPVEVVTIEPHPNADALEIANIQGFQAIVRKGQFQTGQLIAYIPEAAIVPDDLLESMGLMGALHGPGKNRVKAIRLRGIVSQGLVYPVREGWVEGQDVAGELGITKWEPRPDVPDDGEPRPRRTPQGNPNAFSVGSSRTIRYDIENYRSHAKRGILQEGEPVTYTEKITRPTAGWVRSLTGRTTMPSRMCAPLPLTVSVPRVYSCMDSTENGPR